MITGRGPGAPGVTPGPEFTRRRAAAGGTGGQAVDLGEIRRAEEAINVLAARRAAGPELTHDPALALLSALVAEVDTPSTLAGADPGWPGWPDWPRRAAAEQAGAWQALAGPSSQDAAGWLRAGVAGGVVAGLASVTSLIATSMLARLTRGPARGARWGSRRARSRRVR
ncbi:MAG TPA: hypothetical protein VIK57_04235 [Streptosporangiaceae bacterium]